jgi:hypothetical protein
VRDPENPHDKGAIKVMRSTGEQLGFIPKHVSRHGDSSGLASQMDRGEKYYARITDLTGGGSKNLGVNIEIMGAEDAETVAAPPPTRAVMVHSNLKWLFLFAAVLLLVAVVLNALK